MFGTGPKGHRETISPSAGRSLLVFHEKTESGGSQYWLATLWYFASASQHELESDSSRVKRCRGVLAVPHGRVVLTGTGSGFHFIERLRLAKAGFVSPLEYPRVLASVVLALAYA